MRLLAYCVIVEPAARQSVPLDGILQRLWLIVMLTQRDCHAAGTSVSNHPIWLSKYTYPADYSSSPLSPASSQSNGSYPPHPRVVGSSMVFHSGNVGGGRLC